MKLAKYILLIFIIPQICSALDILGCSSHRESWKCEIGNDCICVISGNCTNGSLLVYQEDIRSLLCSPQISEGIARIDLEFCEAIYYRNLKVKADCDEGMSQEKIITIIPKSEVISTTLPSTLNLTTTIAQRVTTTISCGLRGQYCGPGRAACCSGLVCCPDSVCRESCESEGLKIDIWLVIIGAISVLIVIGILFFVGSII